MHKPVVMINIIGKEKILNSDTWENIGSFDVYYIMHILQRKRVGKRIGMG